MSLFVAASYSSIITVRSHSKLRICFVAYMWSLKWSFIKKQIHKWLKSVKIMKPHSRKSTYWKMVVCELIPIINDRSLFWHVRFIEIVNYGLYTTTVEWGCTNHCKDLLSINWGQHCPFIPSPTLTSYS